MDSQDIKQRIRDTDHPTSTTNMNRRGVGRSSRRDPKRMAMAKRGIRSVAVALSLPLSLTLLFIFSFGSSNAFSDDVSHAFWFPPLWILHAASLASTFFMGLSAWLVWAEGGFHNNPAALSVYLGEVGISLAWYPIVFWMGATWLGFVSCLALFGALVGCSRHFKAVNPIAGDLVKPCLAWAAFLALVNLKLLFL